MVSLIVSTSYLEEIKKKPKLLAFNKLLNREAVIINASNEELEIDRFYFNLIKALHENDQKGFLNYYDQFSERIPSEDTNWVHNDILLFIIICGIIKYELDATWIAKVLSFRSNSTELNKSINITFRNLISANYNSKDNLLEIVIVFLDLLILPQLTNDLLNNAYLSINRKFSEDYSRNDFVRLIALRAFDIIIYSKETPDSVGISNLRNFKLIFIKRVELYRNVIYYTLIAIFIVWNYRLIMNSTDFKNYLNDISLLAGVLGIGLMAAFKWVRIFIGWLILKIFGYLKYFKNEI